VTLEHPVLAVTLVATPELVPLMEVESLFAEEAPSEDVAAAAEGHIPHLDYRNV
jgi:hypothetical protein